jgi:hypothetical protein
MFKFNRAKLTDALSEMRQQLEALRAEIATLKAEQAELTSAGLTLAEAKARLSGYIEQLGQTYAEQVDLTVFTRPGYRPSKDRLMPATEITPTTPATTKDLRLEFLCFCFGDTLKHRLTDLLAGQLGKDYQGVAELDRARRLTEIDARLLELETAEEALISEAEAVGIEIDRRPEASPAAVLQVGP